MVGRRWTAGGVNEGETVSSRSANLNDIGNCLKGRTKSLPSKSRMRPPGLGGVVALRARLRIYFHWSLRDGHIWRGIRAQIQLIC